MKVINVGSYAQISTEEKPEGTVFTLEAILPDGVHDNMDIEIALPLLQALRGYMEGYFNYPVSSSALLDDIRLHQRYSTDAVDGGVLIRMWTDVTPKP